LIDNSGVIGRENVDARLLPRGDSCRLIVVLRWYFDVRRVASDSHIRRMGRRRHVAIVFVTALSCESVRCPTWEVTP
jgi:hypothetical protein